MKETRTVLAGWMLGSIDDASMIFRPNEEGNIQPFICNDIQRKKCEVDQVCHECKRVLDESKNELIKSDPIVLQMLSLIHI